MRCVTFVGLVCVLLFSVSAQASGVDQTADFQIDEAATNPAPNTNHAKNRANSKLAHNRPHTRHFHNSVPVPLSVRCFVSKDDIAWPLGIQGRLGDNGWPHADGDGPRRRCG